MASSSISHAWKRTSPSYDRSVIGKSIANELYPVNTPISMIFSAFIISTTSRKKFPCSGGICIRAPTGLNAFVSSRNCFNSFGSRVFFNRYSYKASSNRNKGEFIVPPLAELLFVPLLLSSSLHDSPPLLLAPPPCCPLQGHWQ